MGMLCGARWILEPEIVSQVATTFSRSACSSMQAHSPLRPAIRDEAEAILNKFQIQAVVHLEQAETIAVAEESLTETVRPLGHDDQA